MKIKSIAFKKSQEVIWPWLEIQADGATFGVSKVQKDSLISQGVLESYPIKGKPQFPPVADPYNPGKTMPDSFTDDSQVYRAYTTMMYAQRVGQLNSILGNPYTPEEVGELHRLYAKTLGIKDIPEAE